jgi:toxin secretion/phage lysis holin
MNLGFTASTGQVTLSVLFAVICAKFQFYAPALLILALCLFGDYVTGVIKAWIKNDLSSKAGLKGIVVKLCYLIGVAVGFAVDLLIRIAVSSAGFDIQTPFIIGLVMTLLFIGNELISISENLAVIGVPMPKNLVKSLRIFNKMFEDATNIKKEDP